MLINNFFTKPIKLIAGLIFIALIFTALLISRNTFAVVAKSSAEGFVIALTGQYKALSSQCKIINLNAL